MVNSKVSALTASDALAGTELFYADGLASAVAADVKVTAAQIKTWTSAAPSLVTPDLGTPSAGVGTNLSGTAASLTAGHVTTNANLIGPITSVGNTTSIASQTGTGSTFVVDTSPTINTPIITGIASGAAAAAGKVGEVLRSSSGETGQGSASATITVTIASPAVMTWGTTIPYVGNAPVNFTTTGALPTGLVVGTTYYTIGSSISGNTCQLATSLANAIAGTAINTSGTQSGTHTGVPTAILSSAATKDVAAISLTAGDWELSADIGYVAAASTSITLLRGSTNTTAATATTIPGQWVGISEPASIPGTLDTMLHIGPQQFNVSGTTTVYLNALTTFSVAGLSAWGAIRARRVR